MTDISPEDVRDMRRQGDLRAFLRQQMAEGNARREKPAPAVAPKPPGHRPGAWPAGTRPPDPPPPIPPAAVAAALAEYRAYLVAAENRGTRAMKSEPCPCKPCRQLAEIRPEEDQ
jgi:hypothetical protein